MTNPQPTSCPMVKTIETISSKIRSKKRLPILTTIIQQSFRSFSHKNQTRKAIRVIQIGKEVKLSVFSDDMILCLENSKEATRKLLELIDRKSVV